MEQFTFFDFKGEKISREEFVKTYSDTYYYLNDYVKEKEIDKIYHRNTKLSGTELITFLKWKVGDRNKDSNVSDVIITQYGSAIDAKKLNDFANKIDVSWVTKSTIDLYQNVIAEKIDNVGAVYTLAIISIITKGREPIYDKFAEIALDSILNIDHSFRQFMKYKELPDKNDVEAVLKRYEEYKNKLNIVFGEEWKIDKYGSDVDRALWTYGHLFR